MAATRVVEAASTRAGAQRIDGFAIALRWMGRDAMVEELESLMITGPSHQQDTARLLLSEIGGAAAFQKLEARQNPINPGGGEIESHHESIGPPSRHRRVGHPHGWKDGGAIGAPRVVAVQRRAEKTHPYQVLERHNTRFLIEAPQALRLLTRHP